MFLVFDTETTGLPKKWKAPLSDSDNWPRCVQLAWQLHDSKGDLISNHSYLVRPVNFNIPFEAEKIHGISTDLANKTGIEIDVVLKLFIEDYNKAGFLVGHNVKFDINIIGAELFRLGSSIDLSKKDVLDTCSELTAKVCQLPGGRGGKFKFPTLIEIYSFLFEESFNEAHNASADVEATARVFFELVRKGIFDQTVFKGYLDLIESLKSENDFPVPLAGIKHLNLKKESEKIKKKLSKENKFERTIIKDIPEELKSVPFAHLHNNTQFSVLQSTSRIINLVNKTAHNKMPALAITDRANMMGCFHFIKAIKSHNSIMSDDEDSIKIKPIIGCELNICSNHLDKSNRDDGYQTVFLAKNKNGYQNLSKMCSLGYTKGFYYVPRIDKGIVEKYKEDLIVLSGNMYGEVASKILNIGETQAEEALLWWKESFKEDYYLEIMRHGQEDEDRVNEVLLKLAHKYSIPLIPTNNTFYVNKEDANAHDILLCVKDGEKQSTPIGRGRGFRFGLPNQEYYFKSSNEMKYLFKDIPDSIQNILNIIDKIEEYDLARDVLLPKFTIPDIYKNKFDSDKVDVENEYLKHLAFKGAQKRYSEIDSELNERILFELNVIKNSGYPGYFLIVQDLIKAAGEMGVSVGPGRGSAAGSVVAYCLGITKIDPIKYDLLFERFLNPDRVSMPDIDIDFDDEGRNKVIQYVIDKYGSNQVAQIITYGKMAAKSSIRDTARVLDLSLGDADRLAKLIPNLKLKDIFERDEKQLSYDLRSEEFTNIMELKSLSSGSDLQAETINQARVLEGSLRNVGTHACGIIITPDDITNFVPIATAKDSDLFVTQYDNAVVESAGLLKMDFLGLKTLTLIKDTVKLIKYKHNVELDIDTIPLDDLKTYELFQKGDTVGIFQYESAGMQKYLRDLKPTIFEDLIAMNALYRPGPLEYIPSFVNRKNGKEDISYDIPVMEEFLKETYGITVYQEQVMKLSQKLANFSKGDADLLRKAMGKKIFDLLSKLKPKFLDGGESNGYSREILEKIWKDWEAFASYAFNKSHSTCYALIAYQTAYLKSHYPAEYMAAVLSNNMNDIKQVSFFMEECKRMSISVLGPDVNESYYKFTVNDNNAIRFGMGAVKGVGSGAVNSIIEGRQEKKYNSIFDLTKNIDLRAANKKAFDSLVYAGGFDSFKGVHRAQYLHDNGDGITFIEKALKFGSKFQENKNSAQVSLFENSSEVQLNEPQIPDCTHWTTLNQLKQEKEVVGIYISGHPLDDFRLPMEHFCNASLEVLKSLGQLVNKKLRLGGIVGEVEHRISKNGKGWARFTLEDYKDSYDFRIFGEEYLKFKHFLFENNFIHLSLLVKEGWRDRETGKIGDPRINFLSFQQLQDTLAKNAEKLTLQLDINDFDDNKVDELKKIFKKHKGKQKLEISFFENNEKIKLTMPSENHKISINEDLISSIEENNIHFKLN
ncbi:MAG: DNA polymerase III subunit alpha [Flavobacteriaceae bacterium]|nr:DNA polymerase III subunit alpha [Flavobacteriaceae bacterium]